MPPVNYKVFGETQHLCVINMTDSAVLVHAADENYPGSSRINFTPSVIEGDHAAIQFMPKALAERVVKYRPLFLKIVPPDVGREVLTRAIDLKAKGVNAPAAEAYAQVTGDYQPAPAQAYVAQTRRITLSNNLLNKWGIVAKDTWSNEDIEHLLDHPEDAVKWNTPAPAEPPKSKSDVLQQKASKSA